MFRRALLSEMWWDWKRLESGGVGLLEEMELVLEEGHEMKGVFGVGGY